MWLISQYTNKRLKEGRESERLVWQGFLCQRCVHINANLFIHFKANSSKLWPHTLLTFCMGHHFGYKHIHIFIGKFSVFTNSTILLNTAFALKFCYQAGKSHVTKYLRIRGEKKKKKKCKSVTSHLWGHYDLKLTLSYQWCKNQCPDNVIFLALCSQHADDD